MSQKRMTATSFSTRLITPCPAQALALAMPVPLQKNNYYDNQVVGKDYSGRGGSMHFVRTN